MLRLSVTNFGTWLELFQLYSNEETGHRESLDLFDGFDITDAMDKADMGNCEWWPSSFSRIIRLNILLRKDYPSCAEE